VKSDVRKPLFYGALLALLLAVRLGTWFFTRRGGPAGELARQELVTAETP